MKLRIFGEIARGLLFVFTIAALFAGYYVVRNPDLLVCGNELRGELVSPDTKYIVAFYVRDCGATTDFSTNVSIRPTARNFDANKDARVFMAKGICDLQVEWADRTLHIHHASSCEVRRKSQEWRNVAVFVDAS